MRPLSLDSMTDDEQSKLVDHDADPFRIVSDLEQELVDTYHFNLNGTQIMTSINNPALTPDTAAKIHVRETITNYTDPLDLLEDKLESEYNMLARVMTSMAWGIDNQIITNARIFFFQEFRDSDYIGNQNGMDQFIGAFRGTLTRDAVFGTDGIAATLVKLLSIRQSWHDRADSANQVAGRVYNPRPFSELIRADKPMPITAQIERKMELAAKSIAKGDPAKEKRYVEELKARQQMMAQVRSETNKHVGPAVLDLIDFATRHVGDNSTQFEHLELLTRRRFFLLAQTFTKNALSDQIMNSKVSEMEFLTALAAADSANECIERALNTHLSEDPTPAITEESRRAQKAAAARSESDDHEAELANREAARTAAESAEPITEQVAQAGVDAATELAKTIGVADEIFGSN